MESSTSQPSVAIWRSWLKAVSRDIAMLNADRRYWRDVVEIVRANRSIPNATFIMNWMARMYVSHASSGIRRQLEQSKRVVTMRVLLSSISRHPGLLTRDAFVKASCAHPGDAVEVRSATLAFNKYAAPGAHHIDPAFVVNDIDVLVATGDRVTAYANESIAHFSKAHTGTPDKLGPHVQG